jgi:hypothetical protein
MEHTITVFERAKTVHALGRAATATDHIQLYGPNLSNQCQCLSQKFARLLFL